MTDLRVTVLEPANMNLLGLMLRGVIERGISAARPAARKLRGDIAVEAGGMQVTLRFTGAEVQVTREPPAGRPKAMIRGTLTALCEAALGRGRVRAWLAGRLRFRGGPLTLWRLLSLMRAS